LISTIHRVHKMGLARAAAAPPVMPAAPIAGQPMAGSLGYRQGKVVAIFGTKGGIGTSVIAINLAVALTRHDRKVALVDASLHFGDVGVLLNLQATRSIADVSKVISDLDAELIETMLTPHSSGVKALLAPGRPELAELVSAEHLKAVLTEMRSMFDYVIVDTARTLKDEVLAVLDNADRIVLLGTPDIPSIKNARTFFEVAEALAYLPGKTLFVLNKMDRRSLISAKEIEAHIKHPVAAQLPVDEVTAVSSINKGVPFVNDPRSKSTALAQAVIQLADKLIIELQPVEEISAPVAAAETSEDVARKRLGRLFNR
jgi:pilus assembly protein CpaE